MCFLIPGVWRVEDVREAASSTCLDTGRREKAVQNSYLLFWTVTATQIFKSCFFFLYTAVFISFVFWVFLFVCFFKCASFHSSTYVEGTRQLLQELGCKFGRRIVQAIIYKPYDRHWAGLLDTWSSYQGTGQKKQLHIWPIQKPPKCQCCKSLADRHQGQCLNSPRSVSVQSSNWH